ncbi:hypothetical protein K3495_g3160 [Podosphaera aphanis]|nr:hypothetical protein K3495_g3160 [Podosphaera aphanis]
MLQSYNFLYLIFFGFFQNKKALDTKISSITSLLAEDENEAEVAGILGFHRATVEMYRMKAPNNVAAPVRGQLLKLTSRKMRGLAPFIPNGRTKASEESTKTRPLQRESDVPCVSVSRDSKKRSEGFGNGGFRRRIRGSSVQWALDHHH